MPAKIALALVSAASAAMMAAPVAPAQRHPRLSRAEIRFYLMGFIDGALPPTWGAVGSRCDNHHGTYACEVLARTSDGRTRCWHARISPRGLFLTPLSATPCRGARHAWS